MFKILNINQCYLNFCLMLLIVRSVYNVNLTRFPKDFAFGVATSAYQIEGAWNENGKGSSMWDYELHLNESRTADKQNGDIACDSYHRINEDIAMLKQLKINGYRFSLSWPRLFPMGFPIRVNPDAVRYYNELIAALNSNGIEPWVTLYHWDLPEPLQEIYGWTNPLLVDVFVAYADKVFELFGDKVRLWYTINEPANHCFQSYTGADAPFIKSDAIGLYLCGHTMLRAHGKIYRLYQKKYKKTQGGKISIVLDSSWFEPLNPNSADDKAASEQILQMYLGWFAHPIYSKSGDYPKILRDRIDKLSQQQKFTTSRLPYFSEDEVAEIRGSSDFFGLNTYTAKLATFSNASPKAVTTFVNDVNVTISYDPSWEQNAMPSFRVTPFGIRKLLKWITQEYGNYDISITENGYAGYETDGIDDKRRVNYLNQYLKELLQAMNEGCNVVSYIVWSLMDNFEWAFGYTLKFGLYHVDFKNPNRTRKAKASAYVYQKIIETKQINESYYPSDFISGVKAFNVVGYEVLFVCLFGVFSIHLIKF